MKNFDNDDIEAQLNEMNNDDDALGQESSENSGLEIVYRPGEEHKNYEGYGDDEENNEEHPVEEKPKTNKNKKIIIAFAALALFAVAGIAGWEMLGHSNAKPAAQVPQVTETQDEPTAQGQNNAQQPQDKGDMFNTDFENPDLVKPVVDKGKMDIRDEAGFEFNDQPKPAQEPQMKEEPKVEEPKFEEPKVEPQPEISFNFDEPKVVEEKVAPLQEDVTTKAEEKPVVSVNSDNDEFQKRINYLQDENQRLYNELDRLAQDSKVREMTRAEDLEKHNAMLQEQVNEKEQEIEALKAKLNELNSKSAETVKAVDVKEERSELPSNGTAPSTVSIGVNTGDVVNITTTAPTVEVKPNTDATVVILPNDATENRVILGGLNETIIKPRAGQKNNENIIKPATVLVTNSPEKVLKDRVVIKSNDKSPVADAKGIKAEDKKTEESKPQKDNFGREVKLEKGVVEAISNGIIWVKIGNNYSIYKSGDKTPEGRIIGLVDENVGAFDQDGHLIWKK
jgi:PREDICTED: predicted protein-like